jgi:GNAT superfamily N-acetyltransferase
VLGQVLERLGEEQVEEVLIGGFEIDELGVRESARGTGLGRRLLAAAVDEHPRSWLLTWDQAHDTIAFYRRLGWKEPATRGPERDIVVFISPTHPGAV